MPIRAACPKCRKQFRAPDHLAGKRAKCPACGGVIEIPSPQLPPEANLLDLLEESERTAPKIERARPVASSAAPSDSTAQPAVKRSRNRSGRSRQQGGPIALIIGAAVVGLIGGSVLAGLWAHKQPQETEFAVAVTMLVVGGLGMLSILLIFVLRAVADPEESKLALIFSRAAQMRAYQRTHEQMPYLLWLLFVTMVPAVVGLLLGIESDPQAKGRGQPAGQQAPANPPRFHRRGK